MLGLLLLVVVFVGVLIDGWGKGDDGFRHAVLAAVRECTGPSCSNAASCERADEDMVEKYVSALEA
jgi:hypothetical protein